MKKIVLILVVLLLVLGGFYLYTHTHRSHHQKLNLHRVVKSAEFRTWNRFDPKEEQFSASFPKKPKTNSRELPVPGGDQPLYYKEFICEMEDNIVFSISYTTLPKTWLQYGDSLVLGGALKVIMKELGKTELVGKDKTIFKSFPALEYEHYTTCKENPKETAGTLVLVGDILYKVEMTYPLNLHDQVQDHLANFLENFTPQAIEAISPQPEHLAPDTLQSPQ